MSSVDVALLLVVAAAVVRVTPAAVGWVSSRIAARDLRRAELELEHAYLSAIPAELAGDLELETVRHVDAELGGGGS